MAKEAIKLAETATPKLAEGYLRLAEQWLRLATEIEADLSNEEIAA